MEPTSSSNSSIAVPIAIVLGFAMIAVAIFFTVGNNPEPKEVTNEQTQEVGGSLSSTPRPVDETDYIRGNPNAPILLIEYSDYDCPFCKQYHQTLNTIMDEYGVSGRVAWVYRQFPIAQLHPNSPKISASALCVGKLGGTDAFWNFTDTVFEERDLQEPTNVTQIPQYVTDAGVDLSAYNSCMDNGDTTGEVEASIRDAFNIGARGTPYTVLVIGNQQAVINGAQPYETVRGIIENLLAQLDGNVNTAADTSAN